MRLLLIAVLGAFVWSASASVADAAKFHLINEKSCADLHAPKYAKMVRQMQNPPKNSIDVASQNVIYSTFEDLAKKAKKARSTKVSPDGFKPLFVLGKGRNKRALMYKSKSECIWVKVK